MASANRSITAWCAMGSSCSHSIAAAAGDSDSPVRVASSLSFAGHAAKQSVDESTGSEQVRHRCQHERRRRGVVTPGRLAQYARAPVGPTRRDQRARFIRQDQQQMQLLTALTAAVDAKLLSLERVPLALNAHDRRKVPGLGSVSLLPSTGSTTTS